MCLVNDTDSSGVCIYYIHRLGEEYVCGCNVWGCVCLWGCMYVLMDPKMCECVWVMILIVVVCECVWLMIRIVVLCVCIYNGSKDV